MTRNNIIEAVKAKLDEIHPLQAGGTLVDPQIDKQLDDAAISLIEMLPSALARPIEPLSFPGNVNYKAGVSIDVECPADFVRIHRLRLTHWNIPVTELQPDTGRLARSQLYKYLQGTENNPVAALYTIGAQEVIRCYPPPQEDVQCVEEFIYVRRPNVAEDLDDSLIDMLSWKAASVIYMIHGQADASSACMNRLTMLVDAKLKYRS